MEAPLRLRLLFEDDNILTDQQKSDGLDRCWILLPSDLATVSDVASHLTSSFSLHSSCPNGVLLSMDDFFLPLGISTGVFKDRDIVRVWKKNVGRGDAIMAAENPTNTEDIVAVEKQSAVLHKKPSVINDSGTGLIEHLLDMEEDADGEAEEQNRKNPKSSSRNKINRKRKCDLKKQKKISMKFCHFADSFLTTRCRRKKKKSRNAETSIPFIEGLDHAQAGKEELRISNISSFENKIYSNGDLSHSNHDVEIAITSSINGGLKDAPKLNAVANRNDHPDERRREDEGDSQAASKSKLPSRSTRRKKAKRKWRRELANSEKSKDDFPERGMHELDAKDQTLPVDVSKQHGFVLTVVKPGHIRFEHSDEDEENIQQKQVRETVLWKGTYDKKKGQRWGRERTSEKSEKAVMEEAHGKDEAEGKGRVVNALDFEKLHPLVGLPKVGDVLAYRLVELTSSWCPELSTFRLGMVSFFDSKTLNCILVPFPGYPIPKENSGEDWDLQSGTSLYKEDDTLEIEFSSLVDVRLFKEGKPEITVSNWVDSKNVVVPENNLHSDSSGLQMNMNTETLPSTDAEKEIVGWDEISQILSKKKAELLQNNQNTYCENGSSIMNDPTARSSLSHRPLRCSALGPTLSLLRANNLL